MRQPKNPTTVVGHLHGNTLAHATEALKLVVRDQLHVERHGLVGPRPQGSEFGFVHECSCKNEQ